MARVLQLYVPGGSAAGTAASVSGVPSVISPGTGAVVAASEGSDVREAAVATVESPRQNPTSQISPLAPRPLMPSSRNYRPPFPRLVPAGGLPGSCADCLSFKAIYGVQRAVWPLWIGSMDAVQRLGHRYRGEGNLVC